MEEINELLSDLEAKICSLIRSHEGLRINNRHLNQRKLKLSHDHEQLIVQHKGAIMQIEGMVARLKSIEEMP